MKRNLIPVDYAKINYGFVPSNSANRTAYKQDLFNSMNNHLTANIRDNKNVLLKMTFTRTLLKLLHEDISVVLSKEPTAEFCFVNGFYLKGKNPTVKNHFSTFDADLLENLAQLEGTQKLPLNQQFFLKVAHAVKRHMCLNHIDFLRYVVRITQKLCLTTFF